MFYVIQHLICPCTPACRNVHNLKVEYNIIHFILSCITMQGGIKHFLRYISHNFLKKIVVFLWQYQCTYLGSFLVYKCIFSSTYNSHHPTGTPATTSPPSMTICCHMTFPKLEVMWLGGHHHNAEWRGWDDLASYVIALIKTLKRYLLFNLSISLQESLFLFITH